MCKLNKSQLNKLKRQGYYFIEYLIDEPFSKFLKKNEKCHGLYHYSGIRYRHLYSFMEEENFKEDAHKKSNYPSFYPAFVEFNLNTWNSFKIKSIKYLGTSILKIIENKS